ncbi:MAG: YgaP family membrane protein [Steroidobacteraceae bacterium]
MNIDRFVLAFAGAVVLISLSLGVWVDQNWFFLTAFVGLNLLQSSFTGFCPLAMILRKLGLQSGVAFK